MRKFATFLIFVIMVLIVMMLASSCSVKVSTLPAYRQRDLAGKKFANRHVAPKQFTASSIGLFILLSLIPNTKK